MTIQVYYFPTLNAHKVTIALEEMGLPYELRLIDILLGDQTRPEFLAINPNGRIPAMVDGDVVAFESAAIMQYLGRKTGKFYPADERTRTRIDSWLFWQMGGLGPMSGQVNYFNRAAQKGDRDPRETDFAIHRYKRETERLFGVLERGLEGREYLCGAYSIADMCCFTWIDKYPENGGGLDAFPRVRSWHGRIASRPAVQRGLAAGSELLSTARRSK
jgi:GSH-dependent disulfide-bond oxidoreductase